MLGRDGRLAGQLGPLVASDDGVARALLARALERLNGPLFVDLADAKADVRGFLEARGFARCARSRACSTGARSVSTTPSAPMRWSARNSGSACFEAQARFARTTWVALVVGTCSAH